MNSKKKRERDKGGRPRLRHGGYSYLVKGEIQDNRKYIRKHLTSVREGLIKDLGPTEEDLSTAQKILIDRIITKLGVIRLIEEYAKEKGIFQDDSLISCLGQNYITFDNCIRLSLQALGIEKVKSAEILDLQSYLERRKKAKTDK